MNTRYSPSTGNFYPFDIDYPDLPSDIIEVPISTYENAMSRLPDQTFAISLEGVLTIADRPTPPLADVLAAALVEVRTERTPIITALDGIAGRMARAGDTVTSKAADAAINELLDITTLPALLNATSYEAMRAAVTARYAEIADGTPDVVKSAFNLG